MPIKDDDLYGNAPDDSPVALLLIDVINDFEFEGGEALLELAMPVAEQIASLKERARELGIPAVYVNDNFGKWRSDLNQIVSHCLNDGVRGERFVRLLRPNDQDYFVLKPKHSGFYCTSLELLLEHVGARNLIIAGIAGNNCVLATANDAYMRDFNLLVPSDCSASRTKADNEHALAQMETVLKADTRPWRSLELEQLMAGERNPHRSASSARRRR